MIGEMKFMLKIIAHVVTLIIASVIIVNADPLPIELTYPARLTDWYEIQPASQECKVEPVGDDTIVICMDSARQITLWRLFKHYDMFYQNTGLYIEPLSREKVNALIILGLID